MIPHGYVGTSVRIKKCKIMIYYIKICIIMKIYVYVNFKAL